MSARVPELPRCGNGHVHAVLKALWGGRKVRAMIAVRLGKAARGTEESETKTETETEREIACVLCKAHCVP